MKTRGLAVVLAIALAAVATGAVYLYVKGVKQDNKTAAGSVEVLVSRVNISAGTALDPLIDQSQFELRSFPANDVVQGAVTNVDELRGHASSSAIVAGEQVTLARISGTEQTASTGGVLGIRPGYQAITLSLDAPHAGGGYVQENDHITIYAEGDINVLHGKLSQLLAAGTTPQKVDIGDWSFTVVPDVRVLRVFNDTTTGTSTAAGAGGSSQTLQVTLELKPADAAKVILAREQLNVWLALLPPGQAGQQQAPASVSQLLTVTGVQ